MTVPPADSQICAVAARFESKDQSNAALAASDVSAIAGHHAAAKSYSVTYQQI